MPGDVGEWITGGREVTLTFQDPDIFGLTQLVIPANVASKTLMVLPSAPRHTTENYGVSDNATGEHLYRLCHPGEHPALIFE